MEQFVETEYKMTIEQAITELDKIKAGLIKAIYYLSSYVEKHGAS
jgi:hypothetical protein